MSNLSFEEAIDNLSSDDVKVRKEAIESLVGVTDEEAIEPLIKATTDDNAQVRFKAAEILGSMGDVAVDKLIEEFENADGKDKRFLAFALKETEDEKVIPYFVEATEDEDFGVRKVAVRALGELQVEDELDTNFSVEDVEIDQEEKELDKVVEEVIERREEKPKTKPQLLDDLEKTSTLQILDDIEKELNSIKPISRDVDVEEDDEVRPAKDDTLEKDLFNLIDSMYEEGEEEE